MRNLLLQVFVCLFVSCCVFFPSHAIFVVKRRYVPSQSFLTNKPNELDRQF